MDPQTSLPLSTPPKKVLIVEDDFYILDIYKIEAKSRGYVVYTAADGAEALALVKVAHPDIILLDIMLPKVNGLDVLKTIKSWPDFKNIPVVMMTNVSDEKTRQEAIREGAAEYLLKIQNSPGQVIDALKKYPI